jgi:hypothetical protein
MIGLEWLERLLRYSLASAYLKDERPVNLLIVADVEEGKTQLLSKFSKVPFVLYMTDFTRFGLARDWLPKFKDRTKRVIMVPDLYQLFEGKTPSASESINTFLTGVTEEGIIRISTYGIALELEDVPVKLGLIGAIPIRIFNDKRWRWRRSGFISRTLPVSYSYSKETAAKILDYVMNREYVIDQKASFETLKEDVDVKLDPALAKRLLPLSQGISKVIETHGFRLQRQLQNLCMARALLEKRTEVSREDIDEIVRLGAWINLDYRPVPKE